MIQDILSYIAAMIRAFMSYFFDNPTNIFAVMISGFLILELAIGFIGLFFHTKDD